MDMTYHQDTQHLYLCRSKGCHSSPLKGAMADKVKSGQVWLGAKGFVDGWMESIDRKKHG
jgi:hypothetical protein